MVFTRNNLHPVRPVEIGMSSFTLLTNFSTYVPTTNTELSRKFVILPYVHISQRVYIHYIWSVLPRGSPLGITHTYVSRKIYYPLVLNTLMYRCKLVPILCTVHRTITSRYLLVCVNLRINKPTGVTYLRYVE